MNYYFVKNTILIKLVCYKKSHKKLNIILYTIFTLIHLYSIKMLPRRIEKYCADPLKKISYFNWNEYMVRGCTYSEVSIKC
jgi:hypothetical protein